MSTITLNEEENEDIPLSNSRRMELVPDFKDTIWALRMVFFWNRIPTHFFIFGLKWSPSRLSYINPTQHRSDDLEESEAVEE